MNYYDTPPEYFRNKSKRDYIRKTQEIIQKEGRESVSIRRIAREMHCSSANLYCHFRNRQELIYYAELTRHASFVHRLNEAEKNWKNIWDFYVGIWDCYCREAFRNPDAYDLLFLQAQTDTFKNAVSEYYSLFPEAFLESSEVFGWLLTQKVFMARDFEACRKCVEAGALEEGDAQRLNRLVCYQYQGYLKSILDQPLTEDDMDLKVRQFIDDVDWIVMHLAKDLKGYRGYGK